MTVRFERQSACAAGDTNWHSVNASNPLLEDQWNHVMATHNAADGVMAIYVNGALAGTTTGIGGSACTAANPIRLGQAFNGGMDEVSVYKTVLNATQVADTYQYQAAWFDVIDRHDLYVDADLPTVDLSRTPAYVGTAQTVLTVRADDASSPLASVEYRIDGGAWQAATPGNGTAATSGAWLFNFQAAAGAHTLEARAIDSVGNLSAIASATVTVDDGAPSVSVEQPRRRAARHRQPGDLRHGERRRQRPGRPMPSPCAWRITPARRSPARRWPRLGVNGDWQATQPFDTLPYGVYTGHRHRHRRGGQRRHSRQRLYSLDGLPPFADVTDGEPLLQPRGHQDDHGRRRRHPLSRRWTHPASPLRDGQRPVGRRLADGLHHAVQRRNLPHHRRRRQNRGRRSPSTARTICWTSAATRRSVNTGAITTTAQQLGLADGSFTVMAWVNAADWSGSRALLGTSPTVATDGLFVGIQNGSPILGHGGDDTTMTGTIPTGEWVHLAWRFNADERRARLLRQRRAGGRGHRRSPALQRRGCRAGGPRPRRQRLRRVRRRVGRSTISRCWMRRSTTSPIRWMWG